jgi:hypothetical protein
LEKSVKNPMNSRFLAVNSPFANLATDFKLPERNPLRNNARCQRDELLAHWRHINIGMDFTYDVLAGAEASGF